MLAEIGYEAEVVEQRRGGRGGGARGQLRRDPHGLPDAGDGRLRGDARDPRAGSRRPRDMPIIALTASVLESDRQRCLLAGMDQHIAKPIRLEALSDRARVRDGAHAGPIRRRRARRRRRRSAGSAARPSRRPAVAIGEPGWTTRADARALRDLRGAGARVPRHHARGRGQRRLRGALAVRARAEGHRREPRCGGDGRHVPDASRSRRGPASSPTSTACSPISRCAPPISDRSSPTSPTSPVAPRPRRRTRPTQTGRSSAAGAASAARRVRVIDRANNAAAASGHHDRHRNRRRDPRRRRPRPRAAPR